MKNSPPITPAQIEDLRAGNGKPLSDYAPPVELERIREAHIDYLINNKIPESEFSAEFCQYIKNVREIFPDFPPEDFIKESDLINTALALRGGIVPALFENPDYILYLTNLKPAQIAALSPHKNGKERAETGQISPISQGGGESIPRIERISAYELATTDFPELDWVIPGVMPEGFVKLAGKSETGKSLMALNIAVAVALGGYAYSFENSEYQKCKQGRVLYIGLETTKRREGSRLKKFCKFWQIEDLTKLKELDFSFSIAKAEIGGLDQLRQEIEILKPRLAIVDTLALFSGNDKIGYKSDYQTSDAIRKLTREYPGTNILGVTHARQMRSELSPFDEMQGTEGERAGADCTMLIRMENDFTALHISGNDIERKEYVIELDKEYLVWKLKGDAKAHQNTLQRQEIIDLLAGNGDGMTYREITDSLPGNRNYNTVRTIVEKMFKKGDLIKGNDKRYTIAQTRLSELTQQPFLKS